MGLIFSRFRKKKTSLEILQSLEDKIKEIEEYSTTTEQRHKRIVGQLLVYSVGLCVLFGVFCYFYFPAASKKQKILYVTPLFLFPVLFILIKRIISWYYNRKLSSNQSKLDKMRQEKKRLLEEVMDKETFKVAKDILEKFAPETLFRKPLTVQRPSMQSLGSTPGLRRRSAASTGGTNGQPSSVASTPLPALPPLPPVAQTILSTPNQQSTPRSALVPQTAPSKPVPGTPFLPLPAPILPRDRTYVDRVVEYLIGDGPGNRYALICSQCHSHNGMALKEEFEYIGFRCCYCYVYNPARKQRPDAPKLPSLIRPVEGSETDSDTASSEDGGGLNKTATDTDNLDVTAISSTLSNDFKEIDQSDHLENESRVIPSREESFSGAASDGEGNLKLKNRCPSENDSNEIAGEECEQSELLVLSESKEMNEEAEKEANRDQTCEEPSDESFPDTKSTSMPNSLRNSNEISTAVQGEDTETNVNSGKDLLQTVPNTEVTGPS